MTPRQQKRIAREKELKETALSLLVEHGLHHFSMHKLAAEVGLTTGALYRYYTGRDALLVDLQCDVLDDFIEVFKTRLEDHQHPHSIGELSCLLCAFASLSTDQPKRFALIAHFVSQPQPVFDPDVVAPAMEKTGVLLEMVAQRIETAQKEKRLDDGVPMQRAIIAWAALQGIAERKKLARFEQFSFDHNELVNDTIRTLIKGWGGSTEDICTIS